MKKIFFIIFLFQLITCNFQLATVFAQQPTQEWVRRFSWNRFASGKSVKLDSAGNIYVLMQLSSDSTSGDYGLVKYGPSGNLIWSTYYNSPGNWNDGAQAFAVTGTGDVYITGYSDSNFSGHNTAVKFDSSGVLQWAKIFSNGGFSDITLDRNGNAILAGGTGGSTSSALTLKYNSNGDTLWVRQFTAPLNGNFNERVVVDDSNNIYTAGVYEDRDYLVLKYNQNGSLQWYATYNSPQDFSDGADYLAVDLNHNVYVVGTTYVPPYQLNNTLLKLNSTGVTQWSRIFTGIISGQGHCQYPAGIAVTPDGAAIYYATFCYNSGSGTDIVTLKYNSLGDTQWVSRYNGGGGAGTPNVPAALKLDKYNNIYVAGYANFQTSGDDYVAIKYLPNGIQQWVATYNGPLTNSDDLCRDLVIDTALNVYVTGTSSRQNTPQFLWDAATIKYNQPNSIQQISSNIPNEFKLEQNYPNPFNPYTKFKFEIPKPEEIRIIIYDMIGREIAVLVNEKLKPGTYEANWDAGNCSSGVYFYTLLTESYRETKKAVLVK